MRQKCSSVSCARVCLLTGVSAFPAVSFRGYCIGNEGEVQVILISYQFHTVVSVVPREGESHIFEKQIRTLLTRVGRPRMKGKFASMTWKTISYSAFISLFTCFEQNIFLLLIGSVDCRLSFRNCSFLPDVFVVNIF